MFRWIHVHLEAYSKILKISKGLENPEVTQGNNHPADIDACVAEKCLDTDG